MRRPFILFLIIFPLALFFGGVYQFFSPPSFDYSSVPFHIDKGERIDSVLSRLDHLDLIRSPFFFKLYLRFFKSDALIKSGNFFLSPSLSVHQIVNILSGSKTIYFTQKLIIPEGFSVDQMDQRLVEMGFFSKHEFFRYVHFEAKKIFQKQYPFLLEYKETTLEGYLFPSTYYIYPGISKKAIVEMMLDSFESVIYKTWQEAPVTKGSPKARFNFHQVLTIASLIQKEAALNDEMPLISSVFYNRLKKKMLLASDPTVVYALGQSHKDKVYYKDLKVDSPYNTYRYTGFPPSPIASPGLLAFQASLRPVKSDYYFFVASQGRKHIFTKTYQDHLRVQK